MSKLCKVFIFSFILLSFNVRGQQINDLVVFCNDGEPFILILNGQRYNEDYITNVKATGLELRKYAAKIVFKNKKIKEYNTTITFYDNGYECLFELKKESKKKYDLHYLTSKKVYLDEQDLDRGNTTQTQTINGPDDNTTSTIPTTPSEPTIPTTPTNNNTNSVSVTTVLGTIGVNENGGFNVGGRGGNVNVNTKNPSGHVGVNVMGQTLNINKAEKSNCANPMNALQFEEVMKSVEKDSTNEGKLSIAKSNLEGKCYTSAQVKELMKLLKTDDSKLELSKQAFAHTNDLNNYRSLKDTFAKEEKKEEFLKFVHSMK